MPPQSLFSSSGVDDFNSHEGCFHFKTLQKAANTLNACMTNYQNVLNNSSEGHTLQPCSTCDTARGDLQVASTDFYGSRAMKDYTRFIKLPLSVKQEVVSLQKSADDLEEQKLPCHQGDQQQQQQSEPENRWQFLPRMLCCIPTGAKHLGRGHEALVQPRCAKHSA